MGAGGDKLKKARVMVASLRQAVDGGEADIAKRGVQGKAGAKALAKLKKDMDKEGESQPSLFSDRWQGQVRSGQVSRSLWNEVGCSEPASRPVDQL